MKSASPKTILNDHSFYYFNLYIVLLLVYRFNLRMTDV